MHYPQEYLCIAGGFEFPLHVYLVHNRTFKDITNLHCFVGYSPLIFAFPSSSIDDVSQNITLAFRNSKNETFNPKDAVATLTLNKMDQQINGNILLYEGIKGAHRFVSSFNQYAFQLYNNLFSSKAGNVFLKGNLYTQVQIAYSIPRKICLITVSENNLFNLFPTDLHGQVSNDQYIISLRHEGNACHQVESSERIVLCDMNADAYKKVYSLGKNHMQPLKERSAFDFSEIDSKTFQLPLPNDAIAYKELELVNSLQLGIHKLLLFKIIYTEKLSDQNTLTHIHNSYATWRYKKGLQSNYLLR